MNKLIVGVALGAAVGYFMRKTQERSDVQEMREDISELGNKAKRNMKKSLDKGIQKAETLVAEVEANLK